jgi:hypothetical protein
VGLQTLGGEGQGADGHRVFAQSGEDNPRAGLEGVHHHPLMVPGYGRTERFA